MEKPLLKKMLFPLLVNGFFLWGVLFAGWSPVLLLIGFWIEEAFNLIFYCIKMLTLQFRLNEKGGCVYPFSLAMFFFVHTIFVVVIIALLGNSYSDNIDWGETILGLVFGKFYLLEPDAVLMLIQNIVILGGLYLFKFFWKFLRNKQYAVLNQESLFQNSLKPLILLHLVIIFGMGALMIVQLPAAFAFVIVVIKFLMELVFEKKRPTRITPTADQYRNL